MNLVERKRKEKGLTQTELARRIGVSHAAVNQYEHGVRRPSVDVAMRLGEVLGFAWAEIYRKHPPEGGKEE